MKIFVIKGKCKGMVKVDKAIHLSVTACAGEVAAAVFFDGTAIEVLDRRDFGRGLVSFQPTAVVLLDEAKQIIGYGSINGATDVAAIMAEYNKKYAAKPKPTFTAETAKNAHKPVAEKGENMRAERAADKGKTEQVIDVCDTPPQQNMQQNTAQNIAVENECFNPTDMPQQLSKTADGNAARGTQIEGTLPELQSDTADGNCCGTSKDSIVLDGDDALDEGVQFVAETIDVSHCKRTDYFELIRKDLDKFFASLPRNEELESKVWGSKWVRSSGDDDYSVGVIFEDNKPQIIAYAIPYDDLSAVDTANLRFGEWLKIPNKTHENRGYFVYYQDANTGEMLLE